MINNRLVIMLKRRIDKNIFITINDQSICATNKGHSLSHEESHNNLPTNVPMEQLAIYMS